MYSRNLSLRPIKSAGLGNRVAGQKAQGFPEPEKTKRKSAKEPDPRLQARRQSKREERVPRDWPIWNLWLTT